LALDGKLMGDEGCVIEPTVFADGKLMGDEGCVIQPTVFTTNIKKDAEIYRQ